MQCAARLVSHTAAIGRTPPVQCSQCMPDIARLSPAARSQQWETAGFRLSILLCQYPSPALQRPQCVSRLVRCVSLLSTRRPS